MNKITRFIKWVKGITFTDVIMTISMILGYGGLIWIFGSIGKRLCYCTDFNWWSVVSTFVGFFIMFVTVIFAVQDVVPKDEPAGEE